MLVKGVFWSVIGRLGSSAAITESIPSIPKKISPLLGIAWRSHPERLYVELAFAEQITSVPRIRREKSGTSSRRTQRLCRWLLRWHSLDGWRTRREQFFNFRYRACNTFQYVQKKTLNLALPKAHSPSNASHSIGFRANACRKLANAVSVRFPLRAVVPARQRKAASSGNSLADLVPLDATSCPVCQ
jgi:hypothetical protein